MKGASEAAGADFDCTAPAADSPKSDVYALAALLCRLLTAATADAYLCSPRLKSLVAEPLQPFLDRILGSRTAEPIPDAAAFLSALEAALSGAQGGSVSADQTRDGDQDSSIAEQLETSDVDSSCVSGIAADRGSRLTGDAAAETADLPFRRLGHYEIVGRLGHGGMGEVYLGYERGLDRRVAIKVLPARFARDPDLIRRFQAEATAGYGDRFRVLFGRLCEDMSFAEISTALKLPLATVETHYRLARQQLSERLQELLRWQVNRYSSEQNAADEFLVEWGRLGTHLQVHGGLETAVRRACGGVVQS